MLAGTQWLTGWGLGFVWGKTHKRILKTALSVHREVGSILLCALDSCHCSLVFSEALKSFFLPNLFCTQVLLSCTFVSRRFALSRLCSILVWCHKFLYLPDILNPYSYNSQVKTFCHMILLNSVLTWGNPNLSSLLSLFNILVPCPFQPLLHVLIFLQFDRDASFHFEIIRSCNPFHKLTVKSSVICPSSLSLCSLVCFFMMLTLAAILPWLSWNLLPLPCSPFFYSLVLTYLA